jgi:hypothetical protein
VPGEAPPESELRRLGLVKDSEKGGQPTADGVYRIKVQSDDEGIAFDASTSLDGTAIVDGVEYTVASGDASSPAGKQRGRTVIAEEVASVRPDSSSATATQPLLTSPLSPPTKRKDGRISVREYQEQLANYTFTKLFGAEAAKHLGSGAELFGFGDKIAG